jgi:hypothetical protein
MDAHPGRSPQEYCPCLYEEIFAVIRSCRACKRVDCWITEGDHVWSDVWLRVESFQRSSTPQSGSWLPHNRLDDLSGAFV